jgi:hypothetical protein
VKFRVVSRRLAGTAEGDIISLEGLTALGVDAERALRKGLVAVVYDEPRKTRGARKDASDTDKD